MVTRRAGFFAVFLAAAGCSSSTTNAPSWTTRLDPAGGQPDMYLAIDVAALRHDEIYDAFVRRFARRGEGAQVIADASSLEMAADVENGRITSWVGIVHDLPENALRALQERGDFARVRTFGNAVVASTGRRDLTPTFASSDISRPRLPGDAVLVLVLRGAAVERAALTHTRVPSDYAASITDVEKVSDVLYTKPKRRFTVRATYHSTEASDRAETAVQRAKRDFFSPGRLLEKIVEIEVSRSGRDVDTTVSFSPQLGEFLARAAERGR